MKNTGILLRVGALLFYGAFLLSRVFETGLVGLAKTQLFFLCLIGIDEYHCFPTRYIYVLMQK